MSSVRHSVSQDSFAALAKEGRGSCCGYARSLRFANDAEIRRYGTVEARVLAAGFAAGLCPLDVADSEDSSSSSGMGYSYSSVAVDAEGLPLVEEAAEARCVPGPTERPSSREVAAHDLTHLSFRAWCPYCLATRDSMVPHHRRDRGEERQAQIPCVSFEYVLAGEDEGPEKRLTI